MKFRPLYRLALTALLLTAGFAARPALAQTVCTLSAQRLTEAGAQADEVTFAARIDCAPGEAPDPDHYDPDRDVTKLPFAATPGERVIIGASLTDEAPSNWEPKDNPLPDTDFPIRYVTLPPNGEGLDWTFTAPASEVAAYGTLILRVWNTAALQECVQGRDGCEKFGYILLWDQRRAADALELALP